MHENYCVAVRALCDFTARRGDLGARFTPAPTARQGVAGHGIVARRRGPNYQRELTLRGQYKSLRVRGRADGYDPGRNRLEEFKTHRGDLGLIPANQRHLHWTQLKIYGALLCAARALPQIELALVYFDIKTERETHCAEWVAAGDLEAHFNAHCERFLEWAMDECRHRDHRDRYLEAVGFPYGSLRPGQRQMAEAVYKTARQGRQLMVQATTGIGKTLGSLFAMLKAVPAQKLDKIFFLVAKTSGRAPALAALEQLGAAAAGGPLRVLELVAKDSACVHPGRACNADSCPLARGFYDRLPQARRAAAAAARLDREGVRGIASDAGVCPYYLAQEMIRWADVIVGDYHYFFDTGAVLPALTAQNDWRIGLLVDEAHNVVMRARDMYSAPLDPAALEAALACASCAVKEPLEEVGRAWRSMHAGRLEAYFVLDAIPQAFLHALRMAGAALAEDSVTTAGEIAPPLLRFYFHSLHFLRMAEAFGTHSLFDVTQSERGAHLCIRNVNPAPFLGPRIAACTTSVLFSATLSPGDFYRRLLGLSDAATWLDVESPFGEHQLEIRVTPRISTRFKDRGASLVPIAELMARQYASHPGNYLAFFGSFDYLQAALAVFRQRFPDVPTWEQTRAMEAAARAQFLAHFSPTSRGIGFAVLGGAFGEGIDLPGDRLIGAFIATLGLPRVSSVNAEVERRMESLFQAGYEYTYLYPGLQKVVQAAGRVIRTLTDKGTVHLMDDRYLESDVRGLLPRWWRVRCAP